MLNPKCNDVPVLGACKLTQAECLHDTTLDLDSCACSGCAAPFTGKACSECLNEQKDCKSGSMDVQTCKCAGCANAYVGDFCSGTRLAVLFCFRRRLLFTSV